MKFKGHSRFGILNFGLNFLEALGIYIFDRFYNHVGKGFHSPFYVKDTNDFVMTDNIDGDGKWCIGKDLSHINDEVCLNQGCQNYCPNFQDYNEKRGYTGELCTMGLWQTSSDNVHEDKSFRIDCVGEVKTPDTPKYNI